MDYASSVSRFPLPKRSGRVGSSLPRICKNKVKVVHANARKIFPSTHGSHLILA